MSSNRRNFLKTASTIGAAAMVSGILPSETSAFAKDEGMGKVTEHTLPSLPYAYNALEPHIDEQTMKLHHDKHHQAYVNGLNKAEAEIAKARADGNYALVRHWSREAAFNGGGHYLHTMFWNTMTPGGGGEPKGMLADKIKEDFGSIEVFMKHFAAAAATVEGSGWALLHYRSMDKRLVILQTENQHKFSQWGTVPILGIDVWEHAYYLKYQNKRDEYIKAWWNVVNWNAVENNLQIAMK